MLNLFVAFPYDPEPCEGYRGVYRTLQESVPYVKFHFADERIDSDVILAKIMKRIGDSTLCLCDMTGWNPNVTLELGLALGMGKRVQLLFCERRKFFSWKKMPDLDLPVDIRGHARINYTDATSLHSALAAFVQQEGGTPNVNVAPGSFMLICENVFGLVAREPGLKSWEVAARLGMETAHIKPALDHLVNLNRIYKVGKYGGALYYEKGYVLTTPQDTAPPTSPSERPCKPRPSVNARRVSPQRDQSFHRLRKGTWRVERLLGRI